MSQGKPPPVTAYGSVQGVMRNQFWGVPPRPNMYFYLKELSTDAMIIVGLDPQLWNAFMAAERGQQALLVVCGSVTYDRDTHQAKHIDADRIEVVKTLTPAEFDRLFGAAPQFEADEALETYVQGTA